MSNWTLLILDGSTHLVDLNSKFTEVKRFGRFPTQILNEQKINTEFELFDRKAMLVDPVQSDLQSNLKRGPQIISPKDIAWILYKSGASTGETIIEAGSGSGALSLALAQAVAPNGKIITFENNPKHLKFAKRNVAMSKWSNLVDFRSEELNEDTEILSASSVILDLPNPWDLVSWAKKSIRVGGFLICYIPTINQVQNLVKFLDSWAEIEVVEIIQRSWQVRKDALRPQSNMIGHTGFLVSARRTY